MTANTDKTVYIIIGYKKETKKLRNDIDENPLTLSRVKLKEKVSEKYLGDQIHQDGLAMSVLSTLKYREGRTKASIIEARSIIEDCRIQVVGGALSGIDIWEMSIIPSLLTNSETWVEIEQPSIDIFED